MVIFQNDGGRHLVCLQFKIFSDWNGQEGRTASSCQILRKLLEPLLRYGDFSISQNGGRRHLGFLKFHVFNGRNGQASGTASS